MNRPGRWVGIVLVVVACGSTRGDEVRLDAGEYSERCGIRVSHEENLVSAVWPLDEDAGRFGRLVLSLREGDALVQYLGLDDETGGKTPILEGVDPVVFVTVGTRQVPGGRPPGMSEFNVFFDSPEKRPHETFAGQFERKRASVRSHGRMATISVGDLKAGPFEGRWEISLYANCRLVKVEAVMKTDREHTAYFYDSGLVAQEPGWTAMAWRDTEGRFQKEPVKEDESARPVAVQHRLMVAEAKNGSLACFPPPHQFFFARDYTNNLSTTWKGRNYQEKEPRYGFGVRQAKGGGGSFSPWYNAPAGSEQRMGVFYLVSEGKAEEAEEEALKYTHGDRFPELSGYKTFTTHWHLAVTQAAMKQKAEGKGPAIPELVKIFQDMNVNIVHLAEFHGDGHPQNAGSVRLEEMKAMFEECRRLSKPDLLFLPGEEANVYLGAYEPGKQPGHWVYLFPKPVTWVMKRDRDQPFVTEDPKYGKVYRVGSPEEMFELLQLEHGLGWTSHARIKGSSWAPDAYREAAFFKSEEWLGAAWKGMPVDLSSPKLGTRALDLLDDMANWGDPKYLPGEVDVFKIDHTHELYGHMNINYLKLDEVPDYDGDWSPVLDRLRSGRFFVTTGEVLIPEFAVGDEASGETLTLNGADEVEVTFEVRNTFPLNFAEIVSGDGRQVFRQRVPLDHVPAFHEGGVTTSVDLSGRKWVRVEVWDIAANGAFTQPVWVEP